MAFLRASCSSNLTWAYLWLETKKKEETVQEDSSEKN